MLPKERFINALHCRETDILPIWDFVNNPALYQDVLGIDTFFISGRDATRLYREMRLDGAFIPTGGYNGLIDRHNTWSDGSHFIDEWGTSYTCQKGSWPLAFPTSYSIATDEDWKNLKKPDPLEDWRFENAIEAVKENQRNPYKEIAIIGGIRGPLSTASLILGLTKLSYMVYDNPALLQEILNTACDFWTAAGLKLIETGVDAIVIVDDMGANNATLLSPKTMRQMVLPLLNKEVQAIRKAGMPVFLHSCGNINSILPDIAETGILGLNNIQHAAGMDIRAIKEQYGKHLCLIGNVDSSGVMSFGTPQEVEEAVRDCIKAASHGGGHILATDHSFHEGIPLENVYAFIKAGKKYGARE
jgi:uroporphyrinogen decarboxylase